MPKERLYRYYCKENGQFKTGIAWNTKKEKVIQDVKGNFVNPTNIIVVWLKDNTMEYKIALIN